MRERPIIFSAPMVRAILEGRKTQTRRVAKPQPSFEETRPWIAAGRWQWPPMVCAFSGFKHEAAPQELLEAMATLSPFGAVGDRLWVRECFSYREHDLQAFSDLEPLIWYWADGAITGQWDFTKPKPSIHMPRWASRITLEITDVRVERVQEITHRDALAEGVEYDVSKEDGAPVPRFAALWQTLNGPRGYGWGSNPWVWVLSFRVVDAVLPDAQGERPTQSGSARSDGGEPYDK